MIRLGLFLIPWLAAAQDYRFQTLPQGNAAPSARVDGVIVHDPATSQLFLFGGRDTNFKNDLWAYSLDQRQWRQLSPSGAAPPARLGHTVILDPQRRRLILFGGQASGFFSDTWAYGIETNSWQQLARDEAGPSRRYGHSAIHDAARDRMIVSHGFTDAGRFDDTWSFDLARNSWRNISPSAGRPLRRCLHHAVIDGPGDQMLLYGGCASGFGPCPLGDLWSFDLNTHQWAERTAAVKPPPRQWYGVTFDSTSRALVLFAGSGNGLLNDLWQYRPVSNTWMPLTAGDPKPSPRDRLQGAFVPGLGAVFFGGGTDRGSTNELLLLAAAAGPRFTSQGIVNAFNGKPGARSPGELVSIHGTGLGSKVTVNGIEAPPLFASPEQVNLRIPLAVGVAGEAEFVVTADGVASAPVRVPLVPTSPGIHRTVREADGEVTLLVTGFGAELPAAVGLRFDDQEVTDVSFTLVEAMPGVLEIRARIPDTVAPAAAITVTIGAASDVVLRGQAN